MGMFRFILPMIAPLLPLAVSGCLTQGPDRVALAQQALVGVPKETILSCAGVPARSAVVDNREWFTYHGQAVRSYPGAIYGSVGFGINRGPWDYDPPEVVSTSCDATFTLRGGRVERLDFVSPQGIAGNPQCAALVSGCMALVSPNPAMTPLPPR